MIVISDTTILSTLYLIGKLDWIKKLFAEIYIPSAVYQELLELESAGYDLSVFHEARWIKIKSIQNQSLVQKLKEDLDIGESEAIALAIESNADFLLIDERKGSRKAQELGIPTLGLLRLILELKERGIIQLVKPVLDNIKNKGGFWLSAALYTKILEAAGE
ncbi:MAG: DUF3368 domain-containing protein [Bacteroidota bacterium]